MSVETREELEIFFDDLIEKIEAHPIYALNIRKAVTSNDRIILNYHTHGPLHGYCTSLCTRAKGLPIAGQAPPLIELAHIKGVGKEERECQNLMSSFGSRLRLHYGLEKDPLIYMNGMPMGEKTPQ